MPRHEFYAQRPPLLHICLLDVKVLARVLEVFYELQLSMVAQGKKMEELLKNIREPFKCSGSYLADVFEDLNRFSR